jgi:hypothetical protein
MPSSYKVHEAKSVSTPDHQEPVVACDVDDAIARDGDLAIPVTVSHVATIVASHLLQKRAVPLMFFIKKI